MTTPTTSRWTDTVRPALGKSSRSGAGIPTVPVVFRAGTRFWRRASRPPSVSVRFLCCLSHCVVLIPAHAVSLGNRHVPRKKFDDVEDRTRTVPNSEPAHYRSIWRFLHVVREQGSSSGPVKSCDGGGPGEAADGRENKVAQRLPASCPRR